MISCASCFRNATLGFRDECSGLKNPNKMPFSILPIVLDTQLLSAIGHLLFGAVESFPDLAK